MLGIKYRYEVIDDSKIKLAPTKMTILLTAALPVLSAAAFAIGLKVAEKIEERDALREEAKRQHPSSR